MNRELKVKDIETHKEYFDKSKNKWPIFTEDEMQEIYPSGGYKIAGDLRKGTSNTNIILVSDSAKTYLEPFNNKLNAFEYVYGYIPTEEKDVYVRVIKKRMAMLAWLLGLLLLVLLFFVGGMWLGNQERDNSSLDDTAIAYNIEGFENKDPEQLLLPGIEKITVDANSTHVEYPLINPKGNQCNLRYVIKLKSNDEVIYASKQIKPSYAVVEFELDKKFEKGEYPILVEIQTYDMEDETTRFNSGVMDAILVVE